MSYAHHSGITVNDMNESIAFYTQKLGLKLVKRMKQKVDFHGLKGVEMEIAFLEAGDHIIELIEYTNRK